MKHLFTFFFLFISIVLFSQQVQRQKVVVEVRTGTWCPSCPAVVNILHGFIDEGLEIAIVEYHNDDPYTNAASIIEKTIIISHGSPQTIWSKSGK